jgi:hypothetical protein
VRLALALCLAVVLSIAAACGGVDGKEGAALRLPWPELYGTRAIRLRLMLAEHPFFKAYRDSPPISSMKSIPAASRAERTDSSLEAVSEVSSSAI